MKEILPLPKQAIGRVWLSDTPSLDYFHQHDELECNLVVRGKGSYIVQNQRIDLEPNAIVWLFPAQEHLMLNRTDDFALWILVIRPDYLRQSCIDPQSKWLLAQNPPGLFVRHLENRQFNHLTDLCEQAVSAESSPSLQNAILGHLLHKCRDSYENGRLFRYKQAVHPAIEQIARTLSQTPSSRSLESFAAEVGLATESVSRLFKKQIGITFTAYRNRCNLERFLRIYADGYRFTLFDAAMEAGFGSYAQFYRVFSQLMSMTPNEFKRRTQYGISSST